MALGLTLRCDFMGILRFAYLLDNSQRPAGWLLRQRAIAAPLQLRGEIVWGARRWWRNAESDCGSLCCTNIVWARIR